MVGKLQQDLACSSCALLQACADGVRFLDERKAGMVALLDRTVRDATLQLKVASWSDRTFMLACYKCLLSIPWFHDYASPCTMQLELDIGFTRMLSLCPITVSISITMVAPQCDAAIPVALSMMLLSRPCTMHVNEQLAQTSDQCLYLLSIRNVLVRPVNSPTY